jgi:endonuclease/exonuclease/phosphatase family metal-dependent hydrolase
MMLRHRWFSLSVFLVWSAVLVLTGCGGSETRPVDPAPANPFTAFAVGRDDAFEAVTWNLHNFAEDAGRDEVTLAAQAIAAMGCDLVAIQEIAEDDRFDQLLVELPDWSGYQAMSDRYQNLGFVWLDSTVTVVSIGEIRPDIEDAWRPFPRWPLVVEVLWQGRPLALINNHYKAFGDADSQERRRLASEILEAHIATAYAGQAVILLGDLNDHLDDPEDSNVFLPFLTRPEQYRFADMAVALGPPAGWSWGPGSSHLDHILVTAPLFAALEADGSACYTVRLDQALPSGQFRDDLSDHAPVVVLLPGALLP